MISERPEELSMLLKDAVTPTEDCLKNYTYSENETLCHATWDTVVCWTPAKAGELAKQPCPKIFSAGLNKYVTRKCDMKGQWETLEEWKGFGYSNYGECIEHLKSMINENFDVPTLFTTQKPKANDYQCVFNTETVNLVFNVIALVFLFTATTVSVCKCYMKKGDNSKCVIWRNLLCATFLEAAMLLIRNLSQRFVQEGFKELLDCRIVTILVQYTICASQMWFLLLTYFQLMSSKSKHLSRSGETMCSFVGWCLPLLPVVAWGVPVWLTLKQNCWTNHTGQAIKLIIYTARLFMLVAMIIFVASSFFNLSKKSNLFKTSAFYKILIMQTIGYASFVAFLALQILFDILSVLLFHSNIIISSVSNVGCVLESCKGTFLIILMLLLNCVVNRDIKRTLEKKIRKLYRQEFVPATVNDDNVLHTSYDNVLL